MGTYSDGEDKLHLIIPKEYVEQLRDLKGKQVREYGSRGSPTTRVYKEKKRSFGNDSLFSVCQ